MLAVSLRSRTNRWDLTNFPVIFPVSREFGGGDRFDLSAAATTHSRFLPTFGDLQILPAIGGLFLCVL